MKKELLQVNVSKEKKDILKKHAKEKGVNTLQALTNNIIDDYIKRNRLM